MNIDDVMGRLERTFNAPKLFPTEHTRISRSDYKVIKDEFDRLNGKLALTEWDLDSCLEEKGLLEQKIGR